MADDGRARGEHSPATALAGGGIEGDAEPRHPLRDPAARRRRILAGASGEDETVDAGYGRRQSDAATDSGAGDHPFMLPCQRRSFS